MAAAVGGVREIVEHDRTGWLVPAGEPLQPRALVRGARGGARAQRGVSCAHRQATGPGHALVSQRAIVSVRVVAHPLMSSATTVTRRARAPNPSTVHATLPR